MHIASDLFPNAECNTAVHEYCEATSTPLAPHIAQHRADTLAFCATSGAEPMMMVSAIQAQTLHFLAKLVQAKRILEIGCFTGFSSLAWEDAIKGQPGAEVVTLDLAGTKTTEFAKATFKKTGTDGVIKMIEGDAQDSLLTLTGTFNLIFIDVNKDGYIGCLEKILSRNLLAPNGLIIADNALFHGLLTTKAHLHPLYKRQASVDQAMHIDRFNKWVLENERLESVILPMFDGLNLIRVKD
ncbi:O-methyltransferase-domain-containing protein [Geopyxis carbonaria]|nr:O-methyltransferase-domain-containing protein [Geopyxis carbonaria]